MIDKLKLLKISILFSFLLQIFSTISCYSLSLVLIQYHTTNSSYFSSSFFQNTFYKTSMTFHGFQCLQPVFSTSAFYSQLNYLQFSFHLLYGCLLFIFLVQIHFLKEIFHNQKFFVIIWNQFSPFRLLQLLRFLLQNNYEFFQRFFFSTSFQVNISQLERELLAVI